MKEDSGVVVPETTDEKMIIRQTPLDTKKIIRGVWKKSLKEGRRWMKDWCFGKGVKIYKNSYHGLRTIVWDIIRR